jgi:segregation and condensation protein B
MTRSKFAPWLRRLYAGGAEVRLSAPAMETLAVVAYRQPVLRVEIEAIRGVQSGELLRQLIERDLVRIVGRSQELGRPFLYGTTKQFLQVFGLRHIDELQNPKNPFNQFPEAEEEKNVKALTTKQIIPNSRRAAPVESAYDQRPDAARAFAKFGDDDDLDEDADDGDEFDEDDEDLDDDEEEEEGDEDVEDEPWEEVEDEDEDLDEEDEDEDWNEEDEDWEEEDWDEDEDEDEDDWDEDEEEEEDEE